MLLALLERHLIFTFAKRDARQQTIRLRRPSRLLDCASGNASQAGLTMERPTHPNLHNSLHSTLSPRSFGNLAQEQTLDAAPYLPFNKFHDRMPRPNMSTTCLFQHPPTSTCGMSRIRPVPPLMAPRVKRYRLYMTIYVKTMDIMVL